jgi:C1A family cysteine protease
MLSLASSALAAPAVPDVRLEAFAPMVATFDAWKLQNHKTYATEAAEKAALLAFEGNDNIINAHNAGNSSYTLGHNEFSDLTWDQFHSMYISELTLNKPRQNRQQVHLKGIGKPLDDAVDWVAKGAVTPVKNQGHCGSCWAFSTTGAIEGAFQIAGNTLTSLSEEDLVQCDTNGDHGCSGGLMDQAFEWVSKNGIAAEDAYPYTSGGGVTGTCDTAKRDAPVVTVSGHKDVAQEDEDALKSAVSMQPVSIAIEADKSAFQLYSGGVLDNAACGTKLDHGVLVVGYGTDSGVDYWKVKNSWGATWGESGYIRMVRGKNQCGLAMQPSYPTGASKAGPSPPTPPTPPTPPGPTPGKTHYGDPKNGCLSDEIQVSIQGIAGDFCTPKCETFIKPCPKDVPAGVTAAPQCALQDQSSSNKYCALICAPAGPIADQKAADAQCGTNASCKAIQGAGICTYDD